MCSGNELILRMKKYTDFDTCVGRHVEFEELIYQEEEYDKNLFNALSKK